MPKTWRAIVGNICYHQALPAYPIVYAAHNKLITAYAFDSRMVRVTHPRLERLTGPVRDSRMNMYGPSMANPKAKDAATGWPAGSRGWPLAPASRVRRAPCTRLHGYIRYFGWKKIGRPDWPQRRFTLVCVPHSHGIRAVGSSSCTS